MRVRAHLRLAGSLLAAGLAAGAMHTALGQRLATPLGTLAGDSVRVVAAPAAAGGNSGTELDAEGRLQVMDGAQIDLDGAAARLELLRGGDIRLCGPARMSLAGGGGGALLVSLDHGGVELRYASPVADSLLTPDYRITTVVPPGQMAAVSASVALRPDGTMCVLNRGSALSVERLWDGAQQYVINGQGFEFHPAGTAVSAASCPCAAAPPTPVPPAPDSPDNGAGALFPTQPALTVAAHGASTASVKGADTPSMAMAGATLAPPPPPQRHNFVMRFLRWFVGK